MDILEQHTQILGLHMKDIVTGIEGMVDSVSFDTYGCVQATLRPKVQEDGKLPESRWFDVKRLKKTRKARVMPVPVFPEVGREHGPAEKPV